MNNSTVLKINLLGEFSMTYGEYRIDEKSSRSKKIWSFLQYLVANRDRKIPQAEIIELLWPGEEDIGDPANTLKTLLHRIRAVLEKLEFTGARELVGYRLGTFYWSCCVPCQIDTEEFLRLAEMAHTPGDKGISAALEAAELYRGDFLPGAANEMWAMPIVMYYHNLYVKLVYDVTEALRRDKRFEELIAVCKEAVSVEPYDEYLHYSIVRAFVALDQNQKALQYYEYVSDMFFNQMGVSPSKEMTDLYKEIMRTTKHVETDLGIIVQNLQEEAVQGAFYCEYGLFSEVYKLEARSMERTGQVFLLALFTMLDEKRNELPQKKLDVLMERLRAVVLDSLRSGDVFAQYSAAQYILLLPSASYENGQRVVDRVIRNFRREYPKAKVRLDCKLLPMGDPEVRSND